MEEKPTPHHGHKDISSLGRLSSPKIFQVAGILTKSIRGQLVVSFLHKNHKITDIILNHAYENITPY